MLARMAVVLVGISLLLGAAVAVGAMTDASVLHPPDDESVGIEYRGVSSDLGMVVTMSDATMRSHFEHKTMEHRILDDNETPEDVVDEYLAGLEAELAGLAVEEQAQLEAFGEGTIDSDELVRSLVRIDAEARARQATLAGLPQYDGLVPGRGLRVETTNLVQRYDMHTSVVRQRLSQGYSDSTAGFTAMIQTGNESLVMSAAIDQQYHREAVRFDRWNRTPQDNIGDLSEVEVIASEAYPDAPDAVLIRRAASGLYFVQWSTHTGSITAYVDGVHEAVFLERQEHWLELLEVSRSTTVNESGVTITLEQTFATGPMNVTVVDAATGEPMSATVELGLDDEWVDTGRTNDGGTVWLIEPASSFDLRISGEFGQVTLS